MKIYPGLLARTGITKKSQPENPKIRQMSVNKKQKQRSKHNKHNNI